MNSDIKLRREIVERGRRVVIKVGTRLLADNGRIAGLIAGIAELRKQGRQVMLVSSGAVGTGMNVLGLKKRPGRLAEIQALAAVGQSKLMAFYDQECMNYGFHAAQLLLTAADLEDRERHLNVLNCINALWHRNILPIINENDSACVSEIMFGDNDTLAAMLAVMARAELTILLTTVDGLHEHQANNGLGARISTVKKIDGKIRGMARGTDDSRFSIGGMTTKIKAAEIVTGAGEHLWIADGRDENILCRIFAAEDVGTIFLPGKAKMQARKRWLEFFSKSTGSVVIDEGAVKALRTRGRSLLPSGISRVTGAFIRGDTIDIKSAEGQIIGRGLTNYSSKELEQIKGENSQKIHSILGYDGDDVVVHRNNLTVIET